MSGPTFSELYARHGIHGDIDASACAVADVLRLSASARAVMFPLIWAECARLDRDAVRRNEAKAFPVRDGRPVDRSERVRVLTDTFPLPDGTRVAWGAATVAQHRQRIEMLMRHVGGVMTTVGRHECAVAEIEAAGVTCLDELMAVAS